VQRPALPPARFARQVPYARPPAAAARSSSLSTASRCTPPATNAATGGRSGTRTGRREQWPRHSDRGQGRRDRPYRRPCRPAEPGEPPRRQVRRRVRSLYRPADPLLRRQDQGAATRRTLVPGVVTAADRPGLAISRTGGAESPCGSPRVCCPSARPRHAPLRPRSRLGWHGRWRRALRPLPPRGRRGCHAVRALLTA
jgi:hypothetical protein